MANFKIRRIKTYSPGLIDLYEKNFKRDCAKFFRAMRINESHKGLPFPIGKTTYELVGQIDDKELVAKDVDTGYYFAIPKFDLQRSLLDAHPLPKKEV